MEWISETQPNFGAVRNSDTFLLKKKKVNFYSTYDTTSNLEAVKRGTAKITLSK